MTERQKTTLRCPCGDVIKGANEDDLITLVQEHLRVEHDGREYSREEILFMAT